MQSKKYLLLILLSSCVFAQQDDSQSVPVEKSDAELKKQVKSRSGYEVDNIGYGGRTSVGKQLYLDDIFIPDRLRFPTLINPSSLIMNGKEKFVKNITYSLVRITLHFIKRRAIH